MPKFDLTTLIRIAPLTEDLRTQLLANVKKFDEDMHFQLSKILWEAVAENQALKYDLEVEKILAEVGDKKRSYNVNDFTEAKAKLTYDFTQIAEDANAQELLEATRTNLKVHLKKPSSSLPSTHR